MVRVEEEVVAEVQGQVSDEHDFHSCDALTLPLLSLLWTWMVRVEEKVVAEVQGQVSEEHDFHSCDTYTPVLSFPLL